MGRKHEVNWHKHSLHAWLMPGYAYMDTYADIVTLWENPMLNKSWGVLATPK